VHTIVYMGSLEVGWPPCHFSHIKVRWLWHVSGRFSGQGRALLPGEMKRIGVGPCLNPCFVKLQLFRAVALSVKGGGKVLNLIGAAEVLGGFVLIAGPPCLGIC
jgi:hypothetical protein